MLIKQEMQREEIIRAVNLSKTYTNGTIALKAVNISVKRGEMVGVLGTSGSGKTTLFRLLNGSLAPTVGELEVLNRKIGRLSSKELRLLRTKISVIYQHHNIIPGLSVARNVLMGRLGRLGPLEALRTVFYLKKMELEKVHQILSQLGIAEKMFARATDLSGGQQQRAAIARALMSDAPLLLADEPVASVDYVTAERILELFKDLNSIKKATIVMNLHQQDIALDYCSRILVLDRGSLVFDGPPGQFLHRKGAG